MTKERTKHDRLRQLILTHLFGAILDESIVFWNEVAKIIVDHTKNVMIHMNMNDFTDEEGKYADKFQGSRMGIQLTKMEDDTRPITEAHALLLEELWDPDFERQITRSWKPVLSYLQGSLPPEWSIALDKDYYITMVYDLLDFTDHMNDTQLKCVFLKVFTKAVLAIHAGKVILGLLHRNIKHELAESAAWTPKLEFEAFWWFIKNWPDYFEIYVGSMRKYLDTRHYRMIEHLGLRLFVTSYNVTHAPTSFEHCNNRMNYIRNIFRIEKYRIASQANQWELPVCIRRHQELMRHIFAADMSTDHIPAKSSCYAIPLCQGILSQHHAEISLAYGSGRYKDGEGLKSRLVNAPTLIGSWGAIMDNYIDDHFPLALQDMEKIHDTVNDLHNVVPNYQPKLIFGISRFVSELHDQGIFFILFYFILFYFFFFRFFWIFKIPKNTFVFFVRICVFYIFIFRIKIHQ